MAFKSGNAQQSSRKTAWENTNTRGKNMKKVYALALVTVMTAVVASAAPAISGDGCGFDRDRMTIAAGVDCTGDQTRDQDRDKEKKQDGSCQDVAGNGPATGDQDGTPDRDRLRDGSCQDVAGNGPATGDQDGTPDRDQQRDGSCVDAVAANGTGDQDGSPDQTRDRNQDQTC